MSHAIDFLRHYFGLRYQGQWSINSCLSWHPKKTCRVPLLPATSILICLVHQVPFEIKTTWQRDFTCPRSSCRLFLSFATDQDLNFFADNMWKLGMNVTAGKFLFLGDYVDRGMQGLECLAYLFSLKVG